MEKRLDLPNRIDKRQAEVLWRTRSKVTIQSKIDIDSQWSILQSAGQTRKIKLKFW
jgi:hypothetical protein